MNISPANPPKTNARGEQIIDVGFSASRNGISETQMAMILHGLTSKTGTVHLGDCVGGDEQIYKAIKASFPDKWRMIGHPPSNNSLRAHCAYDVEFPVKPYLERNKDIVDACNVFFGLPNKTQQIGGTWYTINYFRQVISLEFGLNPPRPPRVGMIILPNGDVGHIVVEGKARAKLNVVNGNKSLN